MTAARLAANVTALKCLINLAKIQCTCKGTEVIFIHVDNRPTSRPTITQERSERVDSFCNISYRVKLIKFNKFRPP